MIEIDYVTFPKFYWMTATDYIRSKYAGRLVLSLSQDVMKKALYFMVGTDNGKAVFKFDHIIGDDENG